MALRSRSHRISLHPRSSRGVRRVERLWGRLADLFGPRATPALATAVVLAPRRLEPRRMLDAGAAGLALDLLDSGEFVQAGQDYDALNDASANSATTSTSEASPAASESTLPGAPQPAMPNATPTNLVIAPVADINENGLASLQLTFNDPDAADAHTVEVNWGDGSALQTYNLAPGVNSLTATHQYLDDNPTATPADLYSIQVRVLDGDGGEVSGSASVQVGNVAPTAFVVTPPAILENGFAGLLIVFTDPGTQDTHTVEIDWGDGSAVELLAVTPGLRFFTATHQYLDDAPTVTPTDNYTVKVRVLDDDGGASAQQQVLANVSNLPPSNVQIAPLAPISENGLATLNVSFDDPGSQDVHRVEVHWGDGSATQTIVIPVGNRTFTTTHQYLDDSPTATPADLYTITVRVLDDDSGASAPPVTATLLVNNVAPSNVQIAPVAAISENGVASINVTFDDPGTLDAHQVEVDWGDGSAVQLLNVAAGARALTATHQYLDDNPTVTASDNYTIKVRVLDDDAGASSPATTATVTVNNVAPSNVVLVPPAAINENGVASLDLTFADPGTQDSHQVEINWGDGSAAQVLSVPAGARAFTATHQYLDDNPTATASDAYTVSVRVLDDDSGASASVTTTVTVNNVAPSNVQLAPVATINENGTATLNLTFDDPGSQDSHQVEVNWGDGSAVQVLNVPAGARTFSAMHQYLDDNPTATSSDNYTIAVRVLDDDGGASGSVQTTVTVNNVDPSNVQLAPVATINENGTATLDLTFDDPGSLDAHQVEINWGDGSAVQVVSVAAGARALTATHQYLDDNPTATSSDNYTISVRVLDDDSGASPTVTTTVTVNNVAPANVQLAPVATINENGTATLNLTFDDPGSQDSHQVEVNWGDGSAVQVLNVPAGARSFTATHQYLDDNPTVTASDNYTISVRVLDDDGGASPAATTTVTVNNVTPSGVIIAPLGTINENGTATLNLQFTDPGTQDAHQVEINWGDGSAVQVLNVPAGARTFTTTHVYLDDNPTATGSDVYTVSVRVLDDDSGISAPPATATITVNNVAPSNVLVAPAANTVAEGTPLALNFTFDDPGSLDTHSYVIEWGDGLTTAGVAAGHAFSATHTYADNGLYTVKVTVTDDDGGVGIGTGTVTVNNVAPTLTVVPSQTVNEGAVLSLTDIGTFTDPGFNNPANTQDPTNGGETTETFSYTINWGDGTAIDAGAATVDQFGSVGTPTSGSFNGSHTYADNGTYTVTVTLFDDDLGQVTTTFTVTVGNVAPTLNVAPNQTVNEGDLLSLTDIGTFIDPGFDNSLNTGDPANGGEVQETFTYTINWGDGTAIDAGAATIDQLGSVGVPTAGSLNGSHTYADNGTYTVTVTVFDDDLGQVSKTFTVTVNNVNPTLTGTAGLAINEGDDFTLTELGVGITDPGFDNLNNVNDPANGGETQETFTGVDVDWGDGTPVQSLGTTGRVSGMPGTATTALFTHAPHTYADNGTYTVTVRLSDDDGGVVTRQLTIVVNNVAPTLGVTSNKTVNENQLLSITDLGTFTDPGFNNPANTQDAANGGETTETFTYTINWGDGTVVDAGVPTTDVFGSPGTLTAGSLDGSHTYADNGTYTVTVTVFDDDLGAHTRTFTVTVNNVNPTLGTFPDGKKLQGTEITADGTTNVNFNWQDPGFDNAANQPNLANGAEFYETFTSLVDWGDGTVDAVHTYAAPPAGPIMVSVNGAPAVAFDPGADPNRVLTLVAGQTGLYDPGVPTSLYTFQVDWGDGTVDTFQLALKSPVLPGAVGFPTSGSNGQTIVVAAERDSGAVGVNTTASAQLQHTYLGPPDPDHPAADVPIRLTLLDDDAGVDGGLNDAAAEIMVGNPGAQTINIRIDTSPKVPMLTFPVRAVVTTVTTATQLAVDSDDGAELSGSAGEAKTTSERYLELTIINPDGSRGKSFRLPAEVLTNLAGLFRNLPDNHYAIYLVQGETQVKRLVIEVFVRDGRLIDPGDDSQGARDKPPTDDTTATSDSGVSPADAAAIESAIDAVDAGQDAAPAAPLLDDGAAAPRPGSGTTHQPGSGTTRLASDLQPPSHALLRHGSTLASVAIALSAAGRSWRSQVDESLAKAKSEQRKNLKAVGHWRGRKKPR